MANDGQEVADGVLVSAAAPFASSFEASEKRLHSKLEDPVDVYVNVQILNIPSIDSADCRVSLKLNISAFWRDPRMEDMWYVFQQLARLCCRLRCTSSNRADRKKPNVTLEERGNLWYPKISCVNADEMETSLSSLRLLAPKTGLLRADFSMAGTIHNPMRLHDFPLDVK